MMCAIALISPDEPETAQPHTNLQADAAVTAATLIMDARGTFSYEALAATTAVVDSVSGVFTDHFSANLATTGVPFTPGVEALVIDCRDMTARRTEALS